MFPVTRKRFTAWVVFHGSAHRPFWRMFTKRGWRHCSIILPAYFPEPGLGADEYSVWIDPRANLVNVEVVYMPARKAAQHALEWGATCVIKIPVDHCRPRDYVPRGVLTCVSLLKSILGIRAWYVWTPAHLARYMLRNGGKIVERINDGEPVRD